MDGSHGIERCEVVTAQALEAVSPNALLTRCHLNGLARDGRYDRAMEKN